jgi:hypothetical protein
VGRGNLAFLLFLSVSLMSGPVRAEDKALDSLYFYYLKPCGQVGTPEHRIEHCRTMNSSLRANGSSVPFGVALQELNWALVMQSSSGAFFKDLNPGGRIWGPMWGLPDDFASAAEGCGKQLAVWHPEVASLAKTWGLPKSEDFSTAVTHHLYGVLYMGREHRDESYRRWWTSASGTVFDSVDNKTHRANPEDDYAIRCVAQ